MKTSITVNSLLRPIGSITILVLAWFILATKYPDVLLPSPIVVATVLFKLLGNSVFWSSFFITVLSFLVGILLSLLVGSILGIIAGLSNMLKDVIKPLITLAQSIPPVSWMLFTVLWFGEQGGAQIFIVFITLVPIFFFNVMKGILQTPQELLEMAQCFSVSRKKVISDIYFPQVSPYLHSALLIAVGMGWKTIVMSELIVGHGGIGQQLSQARVFFDTPTVFAWTVILALVGLAMEIFLQRFIK
ncbi:ABC transporter permease subunit [Lysinibacillus sp. FSL H8-0500]|uniref:ABC transporter permease n=1 Tax=Lysinibacillus sp. FSL H8-0500 TaxID=2921393 RepID=UPI003101AA99